MQRTLIVLGLVLLILGLLWPWLGKLGLGRLPGDISFGGDGWRIYLPITSSILISAILSLIFWLLNR